MHTDRPNNIQITNDPDAVPQALEEAVANLQSQLPSNQTYEYSPDPEKQPAPLSQPSKTIAPTTVHALRAPVGAIGPALCGFVVGAIFWHLVGFWTLVSDLVFHGPRENRVAVSKPNAPSKTLAPDRATATTTFQHTRSQSAPHQASAGLNGLSSDNCTTLMQDKPGGTMRKVPCNLSPEIAPDIVKEASAHVLSPDDFEESMNLSDSAQNNVLQGRGWSALTTGSLQNSSSTPRAQPPTQRASGWTASLETPSQPKP